MAEEQNSFVQEGKGYYVWKAPGGHKYVIQWGPGARAGQSTLHYHDPADASKDATMRNPKLLGTGLPQAMMEEARKHHASLGGGGDEAKNLQQLQRVVRMQSKHLHSLREVMNGLLKVT